MLNTTDILAFKNLQSPTHISELAHIIGLNQSTISTVVTGLEKEGLVVKQRRGKKVSVQRSDTLHAHALENILKIFPQLPVETIFTGSTLKILGSLKAPHTIADIVAMTGLSRRTVSTALSKLSQYGIIIKQHNKFTSNPRHHHAEEFVDNYWKYTANRKLRHISKGAIILWQRGEEFLFRVQDSSIESTGDIESTGNIDNIKTRDNLMIHPTAVSLFPDFGLNMMTTAHYYFYSKRKMMIEDVIIHTILIDSLNSVYNSYALALYTCKMADAKNLLVFGRYYDIEEHIASLLEYLKTKTKNSGSVLPWDEYEELIENMV